MLQWFRIRVNYTVAGRILRREESPSITGHGCLLTAGGGDFKESEQKYTAALRL